MRRSAFVLTRRVRKAGIALIEAKVASAVVAAPNLAVLRAKKMRELNSRATASAVVPKVLSTATE
jgi:hypothetical protein